MSAIVVTSQNHWRASEQLCRQLCVPIFAQANAQLEHRSVEFTAIAGGDRVNESLEVVRIEGAAPGEIAIYTEQHDGTLIVGDALINFEPYGFTFLPAKYCENHRQMRSSLRQLAERQVNRILFAHGLPILSGADSRLRALLNSE